MKTFCKTCLLPLIQIGAQVKVLHSLVFLTFFHPEFIFKLISSVFTAIIVQHFGAHAILTLFYIYMISYKT